MCQILDYKTEMTRSAIKSAFRDLVQFKQAH